MILRRDGGLQLGEFLRNLLARPRAVGPVEADARGLGLHALRAQQGRQRRRHAGQGRPQCRGFAVACPLAFLDRLPVPQYVRSAVHLRLAEDVRVAADELRGQPPGDRVEGEVAPLLAQLRLEEHLQQDVAELLGMRVARRCVHHVQELVALLDQTGLEGLERLFPIPRTAAGTAQAGQDRAQVVDCRPWRGSRRDGGTVWESWGVAGHGQQTGSRSRGIRPPLIRRAAPAAPPAGRRHPACRGRGGRP